MVTYRYTAVIDFVDNNSFILPFPISLGDEVTLTYTWDLTPWGDEAPDPQSWSSSNNVSSVDIEGPGGFFAFDSRYDRVAFVNDSGSNAAWEDFFSFTAGVEDGGTPYEREYAVTMTLAARYPEKEQTPFPEIGPATPALLPPLIAGWNVTNSFVFSTSQPSPSGAYDQVQGYFINGGQVVPIPAAVWLFGGALGALGWLKRRQAAA